MTFHFPPAIELAPAWLAYSSEKDGIALQVLAPPETWHADPAFGQHCERLFDLDGANCHDVGSKLAFLGFSFCVLISDARRKKVLIANGANSLLRLYFRTDQKRLRIADRLPPPGSLSELLDVVNRQELVRFLACAWSSGPFEVSFTSESIRRDWQRLPNSHYMVFDAYSTAAPARPFDNIFNALDAGGLSPAGAVETLRHALDEHLRRLASTGKLAAEFSGGIDSGIVYARSSALLGHDFIGGVTAEYPFPEFRREKPFRDAIVASAGGSVHLADPARMLPFQRLKQVPCHDEPSVGSTSWGQFAEAVNVARRAGAGVLLNGHGGDLAFLVPPTAPLRHAGLGEVPDWIPQRLAMEVAGAAEDAIDRMNGFIPGLSGYWHPGMFEAGYLGRYANAESPSVRYTSGLVSRDVARAALQLWMLEPERARHVQKPIAHAAFGRDLPLDVWQRPGKVNHIGNVFRGAKAAAGDIRDLVRDYAEVLGVAGIAPARFIAYADAVASGHHAANPFFSQALSVLVWAHSSTRAPAPQRAASISAPHGSFCATGLPSAAKSISWSLERA